MTTLDESRGESAHQWPQFLPDGKHFLYVVQRVDPVTRRNETELCVQALGEAQRKVVLKAVTRAIYVPGHLLFARGGALMAQSFDAARLEALGDPFVVAPRVQYLADGGTGIFAASDGRPPRLRVRRNDRQFAARRVRPLRESSPGARRRRQLLDSARVARRKARRRGGDRLGEQQPRHLDLRRRGHRAARAADVRPGRGLHARILAGRQAPRLRVLPEGSMVHPRADALGVGRGEAPRRRGSLGSRGGQPASSRRRTAPGAAERFIGSGSKFLTSWSPDGRFIAFNGSTRDTADDMWLLSVVGRQGRDPPRGRRRRNATPRFRRMGAGSPTSRPRAEAPRSTCARSPGPAGSGRSRRAAATQPRWSRDGRELFYLATGFRLTAVPVRTGAAFEKGTPQRAVPGLEPPDEHPAVRRVPGRQRFIVNTVVTEKTVDAADARPELDDDGEVEMRSAPLAFALLVAATPVAADDLQTLSRDFWTWRAVTKPMDRDDVNRVARPHGWAPDWSRESVETRRKDARALRGAPEKRSAIRRGRSRGRSTAASSGRRSRACAGSWTSSAPGGETPCSGWTRPCRRWRRRCSRRRRSRRSAARTSRSGSSRFRAPSTRRAPRSTRPPRRSRGSRSRTLRASGRSCARRWRRSHPSSRRTRAAASPRRRERRSRRWTPSGPGSRPACRCCRTARPSAATAISSSSGTSPSCRFTPEELLVMGTAGVRPLGRARGRRAAAQRGRARPPDGRRTRPPSPR